MLICLSLRDLYSNKEHIKVKVMEDLQVLRRLDSPEVATVPGIIFWLLEGEGMHRHPAAL